MDGMDAEQSMESETRDLDLKPKTGVDSAGKMWDY
jgi:hypothetical protein